ncbi:MAG: hypothetical protein ACYDCK_01495 [Thermoplasmatota archaeon]
MRFDILAPTLAISAVLVASVVDKWYGAPGTTVWFLFVIVVLLAVVAARLQRIARAMEAQILRPNADESNLGQIQSSPPGARGASSK